MSKIYCDRANAENLINANLDVSINNLNNILALFNDIVIPQDFKHKQYLLETKEKISSYLNTLNNINLKMRDSYKSISTIEAELKNSLVDIENYSISVRQSVIR